MKRLRAVEALCKARDIEQLQRKSRQRQKAFGIQQRTRCEDLLTTVIESWSAATSSDTVHRQYETSHKTVGGQGGKPTVLNPNLSTKHMYVGMSKDICIDICIDMCIDMCIDVYIRCGLFFVAIIYPVFCAVTLRRHIFRCVSSRT